MTIVINGSGTITGLSAGGLPDASVTAADLASGAARSNFGAGAVLQVVNVDYGTETSTSSATFSDTGLTASITPSSSSNKILVLFTQAGLYKNSANTAVQIKLLRGSTVILNVEDLAAHTGTSDAQNVAASSATYLDSPATTSSVTYKTQFAARNGGNATVQSYGSNAGYTRSTMTLMEIAG